jgi:diguanylate cyclase
MEAGGIAPTPANYEFWYRYVTGAEQELVAAIDAVKARAGCVSPRAMQTIRRAIYGSGPTPMVGALIDQTQAQLKRMAVYIEQADGEAKNYSRALAASRQCIDESSGGEAQSALLAEMVNATGAMIDKTEWLEAQLALSGQEIQALKQDLATARSESRTDPLTGLPNRKAFHAYLEAQAARATADRRPLCLAFGDIDHFKKFNDTWGHGMGDEVLRLVGESLEQLSHGIGYPARYGGEEFCIVMPGKGLEAAIDICEQIRDFIGSRSVRAKSTSREVGRITLSLGIAQLRWADGIESLVERADAALYKAKELGRNRVCSELDLEGRADAA